MGFITKLGGVVLILTIIYIFLAEDLGIPPFLGSNPSFSVLDLTALILLGLGFALLIIGYLISSRHPYAV